MTLRWYHAERPLISIDDGLFAAVEPAPSEISAGKN